MDKRQFLNFLLTRMAMAIAIRVERMLFRGLVAQHPCRLQGFGHPRLPALRLPRAYRSGSPQSPAAGLTRATARGARGRRP